MKHIRLATEEEIQQLASGSDLESPYTVLAMDGFAEKPDFAVVRQVVELDPVYFAPDCNNNEKARFIWGLEERMAGSGIRSYYFNVNAINTQWQKVIESWGATRVSPIGTTEIRYKKRLS